MKHILLIFAGLAFCFLGSCSSSYYKSPMLASTKAVAVPPHKILGKVESKDCTTLHNYMLFFPIIISADFKKMYNKTLDQAREMGGDAIVDFHVRETSIINVLFFYARYCYSATGTAVKFADAGTSAWDAEPSAIEEQKQETKSAWD